MYVNCELFKARLFENKNKEVMAKSFNVSAYFVSQYSWILFLLIYFLQAFINPLRTDFIKIDSPNTYFKKDNDPIIFAHLTDIHVNRLSSESLNIFHTAISELNSISPDFIVFTGDLVDNFDSHNIPRFTDQYEEDWKIYNQGISAFSGIPLIEIGGNHDLFAIKNITSSHNLILDYSRSYPRENMKTLKDFIIRSFQIKSLNTTVIALNPFIFPTAHTPLHYFSHLSTAVLDALEDELAKCSSKCILACHYPTTTTRSQLSSHGLTFEEIVGSHPSLNAYIAGHIHPTSMRIFHHGIGNLEIVGPSTRYSRKFGIGVIDDNSLSWSPINIFESTKGIISYPVPIEQLTPHTNFIDILNSEIRVVMFSYQTNFNISFIICKSRQEIYKGKLNFTRKIGRNHALYSFPFSQCGITNSTKYQISFSGDFIGSREFIFNKTVVVGNEAYPREQKLFTALNSTFSFLVAVLIIITFPISNALIFKQIEISIETSNSEPNWFFVIFLGVFLIRTRFQRLNYCLRLFIFLTILLVFGPLMLFKTEDCIGIVTFRGYYIDGNYFEADHGLYYAYFYLGIVCTPMILLCSSYQVIEWSHPLIADMIFASVCLIGNIFLFLRVVHETISPSCLFFCMSFIIIPVLYVAIILVWSIRFKSFTSVKQKN